jgi:transcriptional regulator with XRE-family HTH domain
MTLSHSLLAPVGLNSTDEVQTRGGLTKTLGSVFILIDEPTYVPDIESFISKWFHDHLDLLKSRGSLVDFNERKAVMKRIWEILTDPNRPCDHISVNDRVRMIGHLEQLFRTQIRSKDQLKGLAERFLGGLDGRRLPIPQALKRARKKSKLSQHQLAEHLGLKDHSLISKCEAGKKDPTKKILNWLKEAENVTKKGRVKGNNRTSAFSVTSLWGKSVPISPILGKSETLPKQQECTNPDDPVESAPESPTPRAETNSTARTKRVDHV